MTVSQNKPGTQPDEAQRQTALGRYTGTTDYGPYGKVTYEGFSLMSVVCIALDALQQALAPRQASQPQQGPRSRMVSEPVMETLLSGDPGAKLGWIAQKLHDIARRTPTHVSSRNVLFDISGMIRSAARELAAAGMSVPSDDTQPTSPASVSEAQTPSVSSEQLNWAFAQIQENMPSDNPQLKSALSLLELAIRDAADGRTAGRQNKRDRRRQRRQQQRQYS
jgi:hypothetical protein